MRIDVDGERIIGPSAYSVMVTDGSARRAAFGGGTPDWIVMRNRLSQLDSHNKRRMQSLLETLSPRIGFRVAPGFSERVIFRQLFTSGLTVLDLDDPAIGIPKSKSHRLAVREIEDLLTLIGLPDRRADDTADRRIA